MVNSNFPDLRAGRLLPVFSARRVHFIRSSFGGYAMKSSLFSVNSRRSLAVALCVAIGGCAGGGTVRPQRVDRLIGPGIDADGAIHAAESAPRKDLLQLIFVLPRERPEAACWDDIDPLGCILS